MKYAGVRMLVLVAFFLCLPSIISYAQTVSGPVNWSEVNRLAETGIHGNRFVTEQDQYGLSILTVDGVYARDLSLRYRLMDGGALIQERVLAEGVRINYPTMVIDESGVRHIAWVEGEGNDVRLEYLLLASNGEVRGQRTIISGAFAIQDPQLAIDQGTVHLVWVDNSTRNYNLMYAVLEGVGLAQQERVSSTSGSSARPSLLVDKRGQLHVVWMESDPLGVSVLHSMRSEAGWRIPAKLGNGSTVDLQDGGNLAIAESKDSVVVLWASTRREGLSPSLHLFAVELDASGQISFGPTVITSGSKPKVASGDQPQVVWQAAVDGVVQSFFGIYAQGSISNVVQLNVGRASAMRPEIAIDPDGFATVAWLQAENRSYEIQLINNRHPRVLSLWERMGLDKKDPLAHFAFVVVSTFMLAFVYFGANIIVGAGTFISISYLQRFSVYRSSSTGYRVILVGAILLLLLDSPLSFAGGQYFGFVHLILGAFLATLSTFLIVRRSNLGDQFLNIVIIMLWMIWFEFFRLLPQNMMAL